MSKWGERSGKFHQLRFWRINLVFLFLIVFAVAIIIRLFFLQIAKQDYYKALAMGQRIFIEEILPRRGEVFLSDKTPAAKNYFSDFVFVSPGKIKEKDKTAEALSIILNLKEDFILEKLNSDSGYEKLKSEITDDEETSIRKLNMEGVYVSKESKRYYPLKELVSHIVGFFGGENKGQYGIEEFYENELKGEEGVREGEKDKKGYPIFWGLGSNLDPKNGSDLFLTIDGKIQFTAASLLKKAKESFNIEGGTIIVMNPATGAIIAMANFPDFDSNNYKSYRDLDILQNSATQKLFEPGSVMKPITMASAINEGKVTPDTVYEDPQEIKIGGYSIYNFDRKGWGKRTMTEVLEKSLNTGAVFAEQQVGREKFLEYLRKFGIFEKTGVDISETYSENKNLKTGTEVNFATASFGQGVSVTPIQLARAFSAFANNGRLAKPYIVDKIIKWDGDIVKTNPILSYPVISEKTASQIQAMLVNDIENGYGKRIKIPGYYIGGKSGTAQVPYSALGIDRAGYSEETIHSFIGFGPAFNPKFLILVKLDNPIGMRSSEGTAAPIFKELAKYIIDYWQIPPDYKAE